VTASIGSDGADGPTERTDDSRTPFAKGIALACMTAGLLLVVTAPMQWAYWSPDSAQGDAKITVGAGSAAVVMVAIGLLLSIAAIQALARPSGWLFGAMLVLSVAAIVAAAVIASQRRSEVNAQAKALIDAGCSGFSCGTPDVHSGPGVYLAIAVAIGALILSLLGMGSQLPPNRDVLGSFH
jgi:hypothetical protein